MRSVVLVSVNVAEPAYLGEHRGHHVYSAIGKRPVDASERPQLILSKLNLEGDRQADLRVHGGPDKAVYAYPYEHLPTWSKELGLDLQPAAFGENLTTAGWLEADVNVGDLWAWGSARLQVCQPRSPCFKLGMNLGRPEVGKLMAANGRTGWYLRVLQPGPVSTSGPVEVLERPNDGVTVLDAHRAAFDHHASAQLCEKVIRAPGLARGWRRAVERRTEQLSAG